MVLASRRTGPIITRASIKVTLIENVLNSWRWMLTFIKELALHVTQLLLNLYGLSTDYPGCDFMNDDAEARLAGVSFDQCRHLMIRFDCRIARDGTPLVGPYRFVLPDFLRHFPAVKYLTLSGDHLPLLGELPAPQLLKKLKLNYEVPREVSTFSLAALLNTSVFPNSFDLSQLQELTFITRDKVIFKTGQASFFPGSRVDEITLDILTGVNWLDSVNSHPLTSLQSVSTPQIAYWHIDLLTSCAATCRSLTLEELTDEEAVDELRKRLPGGQLPSLTGLKIDGFTSETLTSKLLSMTPSIETLRTGIMSNFLKGDVCDLEHPLRALTELEVDDPQHKLRLDWLRSIRRKASPEGLKIIFNGFELKNL